MVKEPVEIGQRGLGRDGRLAEGRVLWLLGLGMAACNLTGARLGVHFALKRGSRFIRVVLLCVVIALVVKLAYDQFA